MDFILALKGKNELLFYFGVFNFLAAIIFLALSKMTSIEVAGVNAWYKPVKFALSIGIYAWTLGWFLGYLPPTGETRVISWFIVILLGFELLYIGLQAGRGQLSHYNISTPLYAGLYYLMAGAATLVSFITLYTAIKFFQPLPEPLPEHYLWAIRFGLILFFIFSLEGFVMGSRLSHTIGGPDGSHGIAFLGWSKKYGDPRVAHFIGMHAMQILPLLSWYLLKDIKWTMLIAVTYSILALYSLAQALLGKPFLKLIP